MMHKQLKQAYAKTHKHGKPGIGCRTWLSIQRFKGEA